jgi:hypothetical protein
LRTTFCREAAKFKVSKECAKAAFCVRMILKDAKKIKVVTRPNVDLCLKTVEYEVCAREREDNIIATQPGGVRGGVVTCFLKLEVNNFLVLRRDGLVRTLRNFPCQ